MTVNHPEKLATSAEQPKNSTIATDRLASKQRFSKGGRNLILLGIISTVVACLTSGISLAIYHNSGDIYLDRSRPGFIPEEGDESTKDPAPEVYNFEKSGKLTIDNIEEYLENLDIDIKALDSYESPFGAEALSDQSLNITSTDAAPSTLEPANTPEPPSSNSE